MKFFECAHSNSSCKFNLCLEFVVGASRDEYKVPIIPARSSIRAFRNIARNRNRCSAHLRSKTKDLPLWKILGQFVDLLGKKHRLLPNDKLTK